jgi:predicted DNA-binding protein YlxM (UPF0122 family)
MFLKDMKVAYLIDFYQDLLDEHTLSALKAYYNDDLSLSEIASGVGISRQGIRHLIKKGEEQLLFFEERLGLAERFSELECAAETLSSLRDFLTEKGLCKEANKLNEVIRVILKGNQDVPESY